MKIQIRQNIFETNSSSSHSITITEKNGEFSEQFKSRFLYEWNPNAEPHRTDYCKGADRLDYFKYKPKSHYYEFNETYHLYGGQFGSDWFCCDTFDAKVEYLYTWMHSVPTTFYKDDLFDCIAKHYNISVENIEEETIDTNSIWVDHASAAWDLLRDVYNGDDRISYILENPNVLILGGNDNR